MTTIYKIVSAKNTDALARKVNGSLEAGFVCQGGVAISVVGNSLTQKASVNVSQAMIYVKDEKDV